MSQHSLATVHSRAQNGLQADLVTVEVHLAPGLPGLSIVGLPEAAVRESKDRVRAAIQNCGYEFPARRITVNLAPADLPKEGGRFDLAIALGILAASRQIPHESLSDIEVLGELRLSGAIAPIRGALPAAIKSADAGRRLLVPLENLGEAALAPTAQAIAAERLGDLCEQLQRGPLVSSTPPSLEPPRFAQADLADVRGQHQAKRALEIAAAGGHSLLMVGPPGSGKSMLAQRLPALLPPPDAAESLEIASVASISRVGFDVSRWGQRPYRAPHHTASAVALVGGGSDPRPGEITLAHGGVLFLDELPEFQRQVLEALREPLETGQVTISRAGRQADFPARFQFVAAMNPCPCGWSGDRERECRCSPDRIHRYRDRISGPLLDRIDLHIEVPRLPAAELSGPSDGSATETTNQVRARVIRARERQLRRSARPNAALLPNELESTVELSEAARSILVQYSSKMVLSARAMHRAVRVARTIADLGDSPEIRPADMAEALRYRALSA